MSGLKALGTCAASKPAQQTNGLRVKTAGAANKQLMPKQLAGADKVDFSLTGATAAQEQQLLVST